MFLHPWRWRLYCAKGNVTECLSESPGGPATNTPANLLVVANVVANKISEKTGTSLRPLETFPCVYNVPIGPPFPSTE
eukprot:4602058-Prorocentrum_lima.AAC.1